MLAQRIFNVAIDALQQCPPHFLVLTTIVVFLCILLSTVYVVIYAPLERVVMLLTLGYAVWQIQYTPSIHQRPAYSFFLLSD
jgi:hypothetical protein